MTGRSLPVAGADTFRFRSTGRPSTGSATGLNVMTGSGSATGRPAASENGVPIRELLSRLGPPTGAARRRSRRRIWLRLDKRTGCPVMYRITCPFVKDGRIPKPDDLSEFHAKG